MLKITGSLSNFGHEKKENGMLEKRNTYYIGDNHKNITRLYFFLIYTSKFSLTKFSLTSFSIVLYVL